MPTNLPGFASRYAEQVEADAEDARRLSTSINENKSIVRAFQDQLDNVETKELRKLLSVLAAHTKGLFDDLDFIEISSDSLNSNWATRWWHKKQGFKCKCLMIVPLDKYRVEWLIGSRVNLGLNVYLSNRGQIMVQRRHSYVELTHLEHSHPDGPLFSLQETTPEMLPNKQYGLLAEKLADAVARAKERLASENAQLNSKLEKSGLKF